MAVLALGAAGCGSDQTASEEVPGSPPELPIPKSGEDKDPLADESASADSSKDTSGDENDDTSSTSDDDTSGDTSTGTTAPQQGTGDTTGGTGGQTNGQTGGQTGGTPTQGQEDTPANDQPAGNGTGAQKFEEFCEQNAGAC